MNNADFICGIPGDGKLVVKPAFGFDSEVGDTVKLLYPTIQPNRLFMLLVNYLTWLLT